jgi:hypothetical protein
MRAPAHTLCNRPGSVVGTRPVPDACHANKAGLAKSPPEALPLANLVPPSVGAHRTLGRAGWLGPLCCACGSRRCACSRPEPPRPASTLDCRSHSGAATRVGVVALDETRERADRGGRLPQPRGDAGGKYAEDLVSRCGGSPGPSSRAPELRGQEGARHGWRRPGCRGLRSWRATGQGERRSPPRRRRGRSALRRRGEAP